MSILTRIALKIYVESPGEQRFLVMGLFKSNVCQRFNLNSSFAFEFHRTDFSLTWPVCIIQIYQWSKKLFPLPDPMGNIVHFQCVLWSGCVGWQVRGWCHSQLVIKYCLGTNRVCFKGRGKKQGWCIWVSHVFYLGTQITLIWWEYKTKEYK